MVPTNVPSLETSLAAVRTLNEVAKSRSQPIGDYLTNKDRITAVQRKAVVKYLNNLAADFEFCIQTASLAVVLFDRFLATKYARCSNHDDVAKECQVISSTCLLLAAKFSDRKLPPLSELEKVHAHSVSASRFAAMELHILETLGWRLSAVLPYVYIDALIDLCVTHVKPGVRDGMHFFVELSFYGCEFLDHAPPVVAAAALVSSWRFCACEWMAHLSTLAHACEVTDLGVRRASDALLRLYVTHFPEHRSRFDV